jgi:CheY-like chemotaxis protein
MPKILLVDDEPDILESLGTLLERSLPDVRVVTASSGDQALELLADGSCDLVLADYRMPGMDGLEFLRRAQADAPGVPRMLITAYPDLQVAMEAINTAGVDSFLTKPLDTAQVLEQVRAALFRRRIDVLWRESLAKALGAPAAATTPER